MKKIYKNKILNIKNTPLNDNKFLFNYLKPNYNNKSIEVFFMKDLLKQKENKELLKNIKDKYAMYSNVYNEKDEEEIFFNLIDYSLKNNKKIHIVGITLPNEVLYLEEYYEKLGYLREDINCFKVDFKKVLITTSVAIENLMWKGSDYKKHKKNIFFIPPIREAGYTKAMYKGINRGVTAGIHIGELNNEKIKFLNECFIGENILSLTLGKVLGYNIEDIGFTGENIEFILKY